jgi:hypothetical protein
VNGNGITLYDFAVVNGGGKINSFYVEYVNMTFDNDSIVSAGEDSRINYLGCNISNITRRTGNGLLLNCESLTPINVEMNITSCDVNEVSTPEASSGGVICVVNTSGGIIISNSTCLF